MRDYDLLAKSFRHCAEKRECASCPMYIKERKCPDFEVRKLAADAIEELLVQRDKALNKMCEFCGICSEKSRTPLECEVAGFVVEPPKEETE